MRRRRSAVLTMLQERADCDREMSTFPRAQFRDNTPYKQDDFSPAVLSTCAMPSYALVSGLQRIVKAIVIGDVAVGKTCLVNRFCNRLFDANYKATIGVDFEVERFDILRVPFNLQIWDTAGQERFKCIAASYYRSAHAIVLVGDITRPSSLENCAQWLCEALEVNSRGSTKPFIFLVATKIDLINKDYCRELENWALKLASQFGAEFWAVSSCTGENVTEFFFRLAALTFDASVIRELEARTMLVPAEIGTPFLLKTPQFTKKEKFNKKECKFCH
ncbi:hypothetical protein B566_EDAN011300 [Ephemera danica]|nr:hypothetical protein B566_EDAN011300 [Ephemera danica]